MAVMEESTGINAEEVEQRWHQSLFFLFHSVEGDLLLSGIFFVTKIIGSFFKVTLTKMNDLVSRYPSLRVASFCRRRA